MIRDFINLLFPQWCAGCMGTLVSGEQNVCTMCRSDLRISSTYKERPNGIVSKFYGKIPVEHAFTMFQFTKRGVIQNLLHRIKYGGYYDIGVWLGNLLGTEIKAEPWISDLNMIVPIPLHKRKLQLRGYNQSEAFARGLSEAIQIPVEEVIVKKQHTQSQTRKSRMERWINVSEIFELSEEKKIEGKNVLLVDDVITSGATLEAAGEVLIRGGVSKIYIATIASA